MRDKTILTLISPISQASFDRLPKTSISHHKDPGHQDDHEDVHQTQQCHPDQGTCHAALTVIEPLQEMPRRRLCHQDSHGKHQQPHAGGESVGAGMLVAEGGVGAKSPMELLIQLLGIQAGKPNNDQG